MEGGKVLGSGTYGCILKPAVPCKGETMRLPDTVSKLMRRHDAEDEMNEITKINDKTQHIPNHNEYYILDDIELCQANKFTDEDLEDFNKRCTAMTRHRFTKAHVQNPQFNTQLRLLQLPDGGKDITYFFSDPSFSTKTFVDVNTALVKLLKGGIAPLKTVNVLHQDIKGNNMVYSQDKDLARLIDWGLSTVIRGKSVPRESKGWPIMFNQPFINIVLHNEMQRFYKKLMESEEMKKKITDYTGSNIVEYLTPIVFKSLRSSVFATQDSIKRINGSFGHMGYIERLLETLSQFDSSIKNKPVSLHHPKFGHLADILAMQTTLAFLHFSTISKYTVSFNENKFFNRIFKNNCDIFGFLSCYVDIVMNNKAPLPLRRKIYSSLLKSFYFGNKYAYTPYNVDEIAKICLKLNDGYVKKTKELITRTKRAVPLAPVVKPQLAVQDEVFDRDLFTWSLRKRCPRGSRRDKKTKKCIKIKKEGMVKQKTAAKPVKKTNSLPRGSMFSWPKTRRCPKGSQRDKKTQKCKKK